MVKVSSVKCNTYSFQASKTLLYEVFCFCSRWNITIVNQFFLCVCEMATERCGNGKVMSLLSKKVSILMSP